MCTKPWALAALRGMVSVWPRRLLHRAAGHFIASRDICTNVTQSPAANLETRSCNLARGINHPRGGRNSNNLGNKKKQLPNPALDDAIIPCRPFKISRTLNFIALLKTPIMNLGTVFMTCALTSNTSPRPKLPRLNIGMRRTSLLCGA